MTSSTLRGSPLPETTLAANAETPNATEPKMFSIAIQPESVNTGRNSRPWLTSAQASALATRKQIEPTASGRHTARLICAAFSAVTSANPVLMLK